MLATPPVTVGTEQGPALWAFIEEALQCLDTLFYKCEVYCLSSLFINVIPFGCGINIRSPHTKVAGTCFLCGLLFCHCGRPLKLCPSGGSGTRRHAGGGVESPTCELKGKYVLPAYLELSIVLVIFVKRGEIKQENPHGKNGSAL